MFDISTSSTKFLSPTIIILFQQEEFFKHSICSTINLPIYLLKVQCLSRSPVSSSLCPRQPSSCCSLLNDHSVTWYTTIQYPGAEPPRSFNYLYTPLHFSGTMFHDSFFSWLVHPNIPHCKEHSFWNGIRCINRLLQVLYALPFVVLNGKKYNIFYWTSFSAFLKGSAFAFPTRNREQNKPRATLTYILGPLGKL